MIDQIITQLKQVADSDIQLTGRYRLLQALLKEEAVYTDKEEMAAKLLKGFNGVPDSVTDLQLKELASLSIAMFNKLYAQLLKDLNNDIPLTNKVFKHLANV
jgi:hypothetical protein